MNKKSASISVLIISVLFFFSGFSALIYEVVWARQLSFIFGTDAYALSTILAVFFTGLALGSWLFGKIADKRGLRLINAERFPLMLYGFLELGIGAYAAATPWIFKLIEGIQVSFWQTFTPTFSGFNVFTFILLFLGLLIPTVLMGGTLPVVVKAASLIKTETNVGGVAGGLYAVNTAGAVLGTFLAGFVLIIALGVSQTIFIAAGISIVVGLIALWLWRIVNRRMVTKTNGKRMETNISSNSFRLVQINVLAAFAAAGFAAIALEVLWTRALIMIIGGSVYAFTIVLLAFLIGIALGSALIAKFVDRLPYILILFGILEMILGFAVILSIPLLGNFPFWFLETYKSFGPPAGGPFANLQFGLWLLILGVMLFPTLIMGAVFPLVVATVKQVGKVYAANTIGGVFGALVTGFLIIPAIGVQKGILVCGLIYFAIGFLFILLYARNWVKLVTVLFLLLILVWGWRQESWDKYVLSAGFYVDPSTALRTSPQDLVRQLKQTELLYEADGISANVAVRKDKDGTLSLRINGKADASTGSDMENQLLLGHLPMLLHPSTGSGPKEVLVVGLGSGITLGAVLSHPVKQVEAIEIEKKVIEAARFFNEYSNNALNDARVRLIVADGRHYLLATKKKYDVITSEPSNPWLSGSSKLFTKEYFELLRQGIKEDGVVLQWLNLYALDVEGLKRVLGAFSQVFPEVAVFGIPTSNDLALVGAEHPFGFDFPLLSERLKEENVRRSLAKVGIEEQFEILAYFVLDGEGVKKIVGETPANTDNYPYVEFSAPRYLYQPLVVNPWRVILENLAPISLIGENRLIDADKELMKADNFRRARLLTQVYSIEKNIGEGIKEGEKALVIDPDNTFIKEKLAQFYFEEGTSFFNQSEYSKAILSLQKSLEYKKTTEAYFNLGQTYGWDGNLEKAKEQYEVAVKLDPEFSEGWRWLGQTTKELGDLNRALEAYQKVVEFSPQDKEALTNLGQLYILRRDFGQARKMLNQALKLDPNSKEVRELLEKIP